MIDLSEIDEEILLADGFEDALIALYDREKCIEILMRDMDREGAEEFFEYNVVGAYVGPRTPAFATILRKD